MSTAPSTAGSPAPGPALSYAQQRLWLLDRLGAGSALNIPLALRLRGPLDAAALERALDEVARRHEPLRASFETCEGRPALHVAGQPGVRLAQRDLRDAPADGREALAESLAREDFDRPFDLAVAPLLRATLLRLGDEDHLLAVTVHHIVADAWSLGRLVDELDALLGPAGAAALPAIASYSDAAARQAAELDAGALDRARTYWRRQLEGLAPLDLPTDRPRPPELAWAGDSRPFALPDALAAGLRDLARRHGVTLAAVLLGAWQALLARLSGCDDVAVGVPATHRPRVELEPLIGPFTNTLVLRTDLSGDPGFADGLLPRVQAALLGALEHQGLPFERLIADLNPPRDLSRHPLVQAQFSLVAPLAESRRLGPLQCEVLPWQTSHTGFDLDLRFAQDRARLRGRLIHNTQLFDGATAERLVGRLLRLLEGVVATPCARLSELPLMDAAERELVLHGWNAAVAERPAASVGELIAAQAAHTPQALALVHGDTTLSYGELAARAATLARQLRGQGVRRGDLVGVLVDRGAPLPVALLGVLQAGAAFVPLDPGQPAARLAAVVGDSGLVTLLAASRRAVDFAGPGVAVLPLGPDGTLATPPPRAPGDDGSPAPAAGPDDLAYVMYTSGSTGRPKGVAVPHAALVNALLGLAREPGLDARDRILAHTSIAFDVALVELLLPLLVGACIVVADEGQLVDGRVLAERLAAGGVTVLQGTSATFRLLLGAGWRGDPRLRIFSVGETLPRALADELLPCGRELWNLYGPTEATVFVSVQRVAPGAGSVPIGRPLPNVQAYVLDARGQPQPVGLVGDLCLGGACLAQGYWRNPAQTAQVFGPGPTGARAYRTGDLARWLPDGTLEFHGRRDRQVKLRGFRIELGEVEHALARHPDVAEAVVVLQDAGRAEARLVAHVVARPGRTLHPDELRAALQAELPAFMVPARVQLQAGLPLTANRKVDVRRLAEQDDAAAAHDARGRAPATPDEVWLAELWQRVLGVSSVGLADNFFDLGGHSLLAMEVLHALERQRGVVLEPRELLVGTLGQVAARCEARRAEAGARSPGPLSRLLAPLRPGRRTSPG